MSLRVLFYFVRIIIEFSELFRVGDKIIGYIWVEFEALLIL